MTEHVVGKKEEKTIKDGIRDAFKNPKAPDDFESTHDFLRYVAKLFDDDLAFDDDNRVQALEDAEFLVGNQWEEGVLKRRQDAKKPTMVFNRLPAFVGQIVGNRRLNETQIKVVADDDSYKKTAQLREGLVRSIHKLSKADIAYNKALENQVISGMGNFDISLEYAYDDVFEQDIKINAINNAFSVVWDKGCQDPTGRDARHVFQVETLDIETFKAEYPDASAGTGTTALTALGYDLKGGWITEQDVRIVNVWRMRSEKRLVALLKNEDGEGEDVVDITDMAEEDFVERMVQNGAGMPIIREVDRKFAQLYIFTATDLLEGPYDLPISRVPIFRVPGWDVNVGEKRVRFGLIRFLKDPQRLHNFWRSIIAEKLMKSPKGNWIASEEAISGRETEWRESHLSDDELLVWNSESGQPPIRVPPMQIEGALIEQADTAAQDLADISNLHEANLGKRSNEVSGKAILARQRVGETGTVIYQDNLDLAIEEAGRTINELIPHAYDTTRTIKILGAEGEEFTAVKINAETDEEGLDITKGKYTISSTTGPSFVTKRVEAAEGMLNMVNAMPDTLAVAADKIVEAQDWPGADEIARRLRLNLAPGILRPEDMDEAQIEAQKGLAAQAQEEKQRSDLAFEAELREKVAKAEASEAQAIQSKALAMKALASIDIDQFKALADADDKDIKRLLEQAKLFDIVTTPKDI